MLALSGCAGLFEPPVPAAPPPAAVAAPEPPKPAPGPGPNEVWLSISDQETIERLHRSIDSGQLKLKLAPRQQASTSNVMEAHIQPRAGAYLDCGTARITTINNKSMVVPAAKSFQQFRQRVNGIDYSVWRSMHLGVTTRLEVKSRPDAAGASVRYQPIYLVTRERLVTGAGKPPIVFRDTVQFGPDESGTFHNATSPCRSNGRFERELRDMLINLERLVPKPAKRNMAKPPRAVTPKRKPATLPAKQKDIVANRGAAL